MLSKNAEESLLIQQALLGDKKSLELLIKRYQDYIYNISLRLFLDPDDALDATQEVLIKVITHLKTFREDSSFKTWLYRIAVNHFLNVPKKKAEMLFANNHLEFSGFADETNSDNISEAEIEEVRIMCSTAMLMCLTREQRLIYIIGEIFETNHTLGAELFGITTSNYRVKLHRAKSDLLNFVSGKCGLIRPQNPCRCPKKTKKFIENGMVNKKNLRFYNNFERKIQDIVYTNKNSISDDVQFKLKALFADSPFQIKKEIDELFTSIIETVK